MALWDVNPTVQFAWCTGVFADRKIETIVLTFEATVSKGCWTQ